MPSYESKSIIEQSHPILRGESSIPQSWQQRGEHVRRIGDTVKPLTTRVQLQADTGTHESAWNYHGHERHKLTSIQSSGPTPSTVTLVELLSNTNFNATGFLLVAMVTGTRQSIDSKPTSGEEHH